MKNENNNYGINFTGLLTLLFIGLKLTGYIHWSWVWVVSPIWISLGIALFITVIACSKAIYEEEKIKRKIYKK